MQSILADLCEQKLLGEIHRAMRSVCLQERTRNEERMKEVRERMQTLAKIVENADIHWKDRQRKLTIAVDERMDVVEEKADSLAEVLVAKGVLTK